MPKLTCPCRFVHNLASTSANGWRTTRDEDFDRHWAAIENGNVNEIVATMGLLFEGPECRRLMWKKPGEMQFLIYARESPVD